MNTSAFDPNAFLDAQQNEANEKLPALPAENPSEPSGCYRAVIGEITTASGTIGKGERTGQPWASMVIPLRIQVPSSIQGMGFPPEMTLTDRAFLDLNAQGGLDNSKGKNRSQLAYRVACGMNNPGQPFAWRMLQGKTVMVKVVHELYNEAIVAKVGAILPG